MEVQYPILAIDYGEKHFGLAISDFKGILASPLEVISITKNRGIDEVIKDILALCEEYNAKTILVGMPQSFTEAHNTTEKKVLKFVEKLKLHTNIPILLHDESFSTLSGQNMLRFSGQNIKNTRKKIDKIAATVFLQEFLNSKNNNNGKI
ncbi:MAG: Holliday junction resolvase RuvX [Candidatus Dojkabacteria bacterium]|jgi:putative Holliday junction resolvase